MRKIITPEPIQLVNEATGEPLKRSQTDPRPEPPYSLYSTIVNHVVADPAWGKGRAARQDANEFKKKTRDAAPGGPVFITQGCYDRAVKVIENPEIHQPMNIESQLEPHFDAIYDAKPAKDGEYEAWVVAQAKIEEAKQLPSPDDDE